MTKYIVARLLQMLLVLWGVSFVAFAVMFLSGDPAGAMVGEGWSRQMIDDFRRQMGFDQPWYVQYGRFMANAVRGDLGVSLRQRQPNLQLILDRMPATIELTLAAMLISLVIALPVGIISATRRGSWLDNLTMLG